MRAKQTYLKGKSVFIVSIVSITITCLTIYYTGQNFNRSLSDNLYLSLVIIASALFIFMTTGLYKGIGIEDNFPKYKNFKTGDLISGSGSLPEIPIGEVGDGIGGIIISILLWVVMTIVFFVLLILLEALFWISLFIILSMIYWVFFRALKVVFSKSKITKGNIINSLRYSFLYTITYTGWLFAIAYFTQEHTQIL